MFESRGGRSLLRYVTRPEKAAVVEATLETILLVEDEPAVRQLFAAALKRAGYSVYEARNGQEAMKVFDQHGESIDLLLTDMRMPYMGGAELAHQLRAPPDAEAALHLRLPRQSRPRAGGRLSREALLPRGPPQEGSRSSG